MAKLNEAGVGRERRTQRREVKGVWWAAEQFQQRPKSRQSESKENETIQTKDKAGAPSCSTYICGQASPLLKPGQPSARAEWASLHYDTWPKGG